MAISKTKQKGESVSVELLVEVIAVAGTKTWQRRQHQIVICSVLILHDALCDVGHVERAVDLGHLCCLEVYAPGVHVPVDLHDVWRQLSSGSTACHLPCRCGTPHTRRWWNHHRWCRVEPPASWWPQWPRTPAGTSCRRPWPLCWGSSHCHQIALTSGQRVASEIGWQSAPRSDWSNRHQNRGRGESLSKQQMWIQRADLETQTQMNQRFPESHVNECPPKMPPPQKKKIRGGGYYWEVNISL